MTAIVMVDAAWAIGRDGDQLCYIPPDLKRFQRRTTGHPVLVGRKTLATFPGGRPLKNRRNLILSRDPSFAPVGGEVYASLDQALAAAPADRRLLRLTIRRVQQTLIIKVENSYGQAPRRDQGALVSAKKDRTRHGWGLKSVQAAAERYEGVLQTDWADGVFRAVVTLSFQPVKLP